jgi:predicted nucleotidyltransferase
MRENQMKATDEAVERAVAILSADPRVRVVYLFGSAARSASIPPRDLDLAVCVRPALSLAELLGLQGKLQEAVDVAVDLVSFDEAPIVLAHEIIEGGRCLYARSPEDETELVTRTRMRWWDWLPVREQQWRASGERLEARLGPEA